MVLTGSGAIEKTIQVCGILSCIPAFKRTLYARLHTNTSGLCNKDIAATSCQPFVPSCYSGTHLQPPNGNGAMRMCATSCSLAVCPQMFEPSSVCGVVYMRIGVGGRRSVFPCTSVAGLAFGTVRTRAQTTLFRRRFPTSPHCSARVCRQCAPFFIPHPCCAGKGCPFQHHYNYKLEYSIQRERKREMEV